MDELVPQQRSDFWQWGDYHLLLLASAVKRHGTSNWSLVLQELKSCGLKNGIHISAEACEQKFDAWRGQHASSSDSRDHEICDIMLSELTRQRVSYLKRELEVYDENIGSLQRKIRKLRAERALCLASNRSSGQAVAHTIADSDDVSYEYDRVCSTAEMRPCEVSPPLQPVTVEETLKPGYAKVVACGTVDGEPPDKICLHQSSSGEKDPSAGSACTEEHRMEEIGVEDGSSVGLDSRDTRFQDGREQDRVMKDNPCKQCTCAKDMASDSPKENGVSCGHSDEAIRDSCRVTCSEVNIHSLSLDEVSSMSSSDELPSSNSRHVNYQLPVNSESNGTQGFQLADRYEACVLKVEASGEPASASAKLSSVSKDDSMFCCHDSLTRSTKPATEATICLMTSEEPSSIILPPSDPISHSVSKQVLDSSVKSSLHPFARISYEHVDSLNHDDVDAPSLEGPVLLKIEAEVLSSASCFVTEKIKCVRCPTQSPHAADLQGNMPSETRDENGSEEQNLLVHSQFVERSAIQGSQQKACSQSAVQLELPVPCPGLSLPSITSWENQILTQSEEAAPRCGQEAKAKLNILKSGNLFRISEEENVGKSGSELDSKTIADQQGRSRDTDKHTYSPATSPNSSSVPDCMACCASHEGTGAADEQVTDLDDTEEVQGSRNSRYSQIEKSEAASPLEGADDSSPISRRSKREPKVAGKLLPLLDCLRAICMHKFAPFFKQKQQSQENTRYHQLIRRHIDLSMIRARLEEGVYSGSLEFFRDLLLIFNNALVYYERDAPEHVASKILRDSAMQEMRSILKTEALLKQDGPSTRNRDPKKGLDSFRVMTLSLPGRRGSLRLSSIDNHSTDSTLDFEDVTKRESYSTMGPGNFSLNNDGGNNEEEVDERFKELRMVSRSLRVQVKDLGELDNKKPAKTLARARQRSVKEERSCSSKATVRCKLKEDAVAHKVSSKSSVKSEKGSQSPIVLDFKSSKSRLLTPSDAVVQGKSRPARMSKRPASVSQVSKDTKRPPERPPETQLKKRVRK